MSLPCRASLRLTLALILAAPLALAAGCRGKTEPAPPPAAAAPALGPDGKPLPEPVPFRFRFVKGSRDAKHYLDPKLEVVKKQLASLAWTRWEQLSDTTVTLTPGAPTFVDLPDGVKAAISLLEVRGNIVKIEVSIPVKNTQSRVTTERGQRILHQVVKEKKGVAYFMVLTPWPTGP
jgi:hypothetical protein